MAEVFINGPFFSASQADVDEFMAEAVYRVAEAGVKIWHTELDRNLVTQTPYYTTQLQDYPVGPFMSIVDDNEVVYGPWLEGVGSRNKTTRFKGYHSLRRASQELRAKVPEITKPAFDALILRMNA